MLRSGSITLTCLAILVGSASAQDAAQPAQPPPAPAPSEPAPAPAPSEPAAAPDPAPAAKLTGADRPLRLPIHSHRVSLFGALVGKDTARDHEVIATPLDTDVQRLAIDLDSSSALGLRYSYQLFERWGVELSLSKSSTELVNQRTFDRAATEAALVASSEDPALFPAFLDRLEAHSKPQGIDVTSFEVGATFVVNPRSRWLAEVTAGLGWAEGSLDGPVAIFEQAAFSSPGTDPNDPQPIVFANEIVDPTGGTDCPAFDDPCVSMRDGSGLTWHAGGTLSFAATRHVHARLGMRFRYHEHVVDPGDSFLIPETSLGVSFVFGGE